jgi:hypothetical protein
METVRGIVDHDTIRLVTPLSLPQGAEIEFEPRVVQNQNDSTLGCNSPELYDIMSRSYDTGDTTAAARVDEHQP